MKILSFFVLMFLTFSLFGQGKKELAPTPPMGWNSWNWFGKKEINEQNMKECMDAIVQQGLLDAGYRYFVIDGGWRDTKLGPKGELLPNPTKFPHGMKAMADYAHSLGLKFGLHTVPGTNDCGGDPVGGYGHEEVQVKQFMDWGLDFIKLDKCRFDGDWDETVLEQTYQKWHKLLSNCGRDIVLSISAYKWRDWYPQVGQMARTTYDIRARVSKGAVFDSVPGSVMKIADTNNKWAAFAGNGYWNDPDMLVLGNQGLTLDEQKSQFALWCIMSAPLILGNDPRIITKEEIDIVTNERAIGVDQDTTEQGRRITTEDGFEIWKKNLKNNKTAVLVINRTNTGNHKLDLKLNEIKINGNAKITNIFTAKNIYTRNDLLSVQLSLHSCLFMIIEK